MKLETAKALKWPWPTRARMLDYKPYTGKLVYDFPFPDTGLPCPSVEEMLERMPYMIEIPEGYFYLEIEKYSRSYAAGYFHEGESERVSASFYEEPELSEALALLCIWLRDNGLMEWNKEGME